MSDIFAKSYATQQARESVVPTPGQPDGNPPQSSIIARLTGGAPNPPTNPTGMAGNPKGPANPSTSHRLGSVEILKELEGHVESYH